MLHAVMRHFIFPVLFLCLFSTQAFCAVGVTNVTITRAEEGQTRFAMDITKNAPYRVFVINNPLRMIIDLPKMPWSAPMNKGDRYGTIKSYRKGPYQNDTLRVVIDLNRPALLNAHQCLPFASNTLWHCQFDLKPVSITAFNQQIKKVVVGNGTPITATNGITTLPKHALETTTKDNNDAVEELQKTKPGKTTQIATTSTKKPLIVIDAGHGGVDPGARATNGIYEKNITLATAKELGRQLEETGKYRVKLTRDTDIFIKLPDRVKIARSAGADMFISLHADTISRPEVMGSSVYTLSDKASDIQTAKLAERENAVDTLVNVDVGKVDADVADILIDLVTRDTMNQSKVLADTVVSTFKNNGVHTLPIGPHRSAGFAVLKSPDIPSVLIEMGYLSNKTEADQLANAQYRTKLAGAVAKVVDRFFTTTSKLAAY